MNKTELYSKTVYQLFLRAFTKEGTFKAAEKHLPKLKELGIDIVYLCPFFEADDDTDEKYLSPRQIASGLNNPKNPYRIKDYFKVDSEYGTESDAADFVKKAHELGMKVIFDLVYYHCGPSAVLMKNNPDYVYRNSDGSITYGEWRFPRLNFENQRLREYLYSNMIYLITAFDVDGFRCDVGDGIPADFWKEGIARCRKIKEDIFMLNEGRGSQYIEAGFDSDYCMGWELLNALKMGTADVEALRQYTEYMDGFASIRFMENHDSANDAFCDRIDTNPEKGDALLVVTAFIKGLFFIYNGNEIADCNRHSIYYNRFCSGDSFTVDWSKSETDIGKRRLELVKSLVRIRHENEALSGDICFDYASGGLIAFTRKGETSKIKVLVNTSTEAVEIPEDLKPEGENILLSEGVSDGRISAYGYIVTD